MNVTCPLIACVLVVMACVSGSDQAFARERVAETPEQQVEALLAQKSASSSDPALLVRLADLYLDIGDEAQEPAKRQAAYDEGAALAKQAIELHEPDAHAHYLYAANLGSAAQLKGMMASAAVVRELRRHLTRALELNPHHAPALHMMGRMLEELPWLLGGNAKAALAHLRRAVESDPGYLFARLDLAKAYLKRKEVDSARKELTELVHRPIPPDASAAARRHRGEARRLLDSLNAP